MVSPFLKQTLREATGLNEPGHILSLWIGLHDIGKAIPGFQEQHNVSWEMLKEKELGVDAPQNLRHHHGFASVPLLRRWLEASDIPNRGKVLLSQIALFVGFHHGRLCKGAKLEGPPGALGVTEWSVAQQHLITKVVEAWGVEAWPDPPEEPEPWPSWLLGFAGWTTLADWVGSITEHFPDVDKQQGLSTYLETARVAANELVKDLGFTNKAHIVTHNPSTLFPKIKILHEVQQRVYDLPTSNAPSLTIVEAPTGEGKTEAAFALAAKQQVDLGQGIYVAMPTMATSNGLFPRFLDFVAHAQDAEVRANVMLVHGTADLNLDFQKLREATYQPLSNNAIPLSKIYDEDEQGTMKAAGTVQAQRWFLPKKRGLLAPYGVGTVDQVLLGVLFSKHFFLRLFGLSGKTLIFDEVHAYDTYMSVLFEQLLCWLQALDVNVILLSATLPAATRTRLLNAWGASNAEAEQEADYPAIWHVQDGQVYLDAGFETQMGKDERVVYTEWLVSDRENIDSVVAAVSKAVGARAAVAVIVNQVDRAQQIYDHLKNGPDVLALPPEDLHLLHARFPLEDRYEHEVAALKRFGKQEDGTPRPPGPAVLVATQVAEQSLDLDFDVMFSDLAPIDLLLQRAGRLHRHKLPDMRPEGYDTPRLFLLCPEPDESSLPDVDAVAYVYDSLTVLRTWHLLQDRERWATWNLPADYRNLVDGVYVSKMHKGSIPDNLSADGKGKWRKAQSAFKKASRQETQKARNRYINAPTTLPGLLSHSHLELRDEEDPKTHDDFKALTRSGLPSVNVICLHRIGDKLFLDAAGEHEAPFDQLPDAEAVRALLKRSVRISRQVLVKHFKDWSPPEKWTADMRTTWNDAAKYTAALYYYRPMVFSEGVWDENALAVRLDSVLGLVYKQ